MNFEPKNVHSTCTDGSVHNTEAEVRSCRLEVQVQPTGGSQMHLNFLNRRIYLRVSVTIFGLVIEIAVE